MNKKIIFLFSIVIFAVLMVVPALSQEGRDYKNKHTTEFGVECAGCHTENPPANNVSTKKCEECHGTLLEIGEKTDLPDKANPHINHNDELYCEDCHHIHKESVNYCLGCHGRELQYDVP